jgi:SAM-dependent methyltransferase
MNETEVNPKPKESWDERYARGNYSALEPNARLVALVAKLPPGKALDLACGAGRHAIVLAENGWDVTAVDNSAVGVEIAKKRAAEKNLKIDFRRADLEGGEFAIEENAFDLICDLFYLQRDLFAAMKNGVKAGGVIVAAIHIYGADEPAGRFSLREGELREFFADFEILHHRESPPADEGAGDRRRRKAEIIARKPIGARRRA